MVSFSANPSTLLPESGTTLSPGVADALELATETTVLQEKVRLVYLRRQDARQFEKGDFYLADRRYVKVRLLPELGSLVATCNIGRTPWGGRTCLCSVYGFEPITDFIV